ncbi:MAG: helix-turn-helix transcriptional regulator [Legionellaceae bacterium]|nr:helix-turn-helix transcriptional regulator [Legionellaceae bacterium]
MNNALKQYSKYANEVQAINNSLEFKGIIGLCYMRVYQDGSILNLASCSNWTDFYFKQLNNDVYSDADISDHLFIDDSISLWSLNPHNQVWRDVEDKFGYGNGVSLCCEHDDFREILAFYSTKNNHEINHLYINQTGYLRYIKQCFLYEASELIQIAVTEKKSSPTVALVENNTSLSLKPETTYFEQEYIFHKDNHQKVLLPSQQRQCLIHLIKGQSSKEIARSMQLSPRTIEHYLDIICKKLGCDSSRKLIVSYIDQLV